MSVFGCCRSNLRNQNSETLPTDGPGVRTYTLLTRRKKTKLSNLLKIRLRDFWKPGNMGFAHKHYPAPSFYR